MIEDIKELQEIPSELLMGLTNDIAIGSNTISEEQKKAMMYAARFLQERGQNDLAEELLLKYNVKKLKEYDLNSSEFIQYLKDAGITYNIQGFVTVGSGNDAIKYPILVLTGDIMRWEIAFQKMKYEMLQNETGN